MFDLVFLLLVGFPFTFAMLLLPRYIAERSAFKPAEGVAELLPPKRASKATKRALLVVTDERTIDSARRVLASRRVFAERAAVARNVEALQLADARRTARKAIRRARRNSQVELTLAA